MGAEYYAFALFIAGLVCIVAIVFKVLFSDIKRKNKMLDERETQVLHTYNAVETIMEEFQDQAKATIEELKLREQEYRAAMQNMAAFQLPPELEKKAQVIDKVPRPLSLDANRIKVAGEVIERAERHMGYDISTAATAISAEPSVQTQQAVPSYTADPPPIDIFKQAVPVVQQTKSEIKPVVFQKFFDDAVDAPPPTPYAPAQVNGGSRRDAILALSDEGKTDVEIASQLGITRNEVQLVIGLTR